LTKKTPYKGLGADSGEKHEPASDIDTAVVDSLKALDPDRPIREADIAACFDNRFLLPSYSIILSARARSVAGISTPIALAGDAMEPFFSTQ
jgi:hypothetical protein